MKKKKFYRKKGFIVLMVVIALIAVMIFFYMNKTVKVEYETVLVEKGDLIQEVSVTGQVEPVKSADLSFEMSGKVSDIYIDTGDKVKTGEELVRLNSADMLAQLRQSQAGLSSAQARLDQYKAALSQEELMLQEMKKGTRQEEINIAQTNYENAKKNLEEAEISLDSVKNKADADIQSVYNGALTSLPVAANYGKSALMTLSDLQADYFNDYMQDSIATASAKGTAVYSLLGLQNADRISADQLSKLNGGAYGLAQEAVTANSTEKTDEALSEMLMALYDVKAALESVVVKASFTALDKTNFDSAKNSVDSQIVSLSGKQQLISVQKVANKNSISSAESQVTYAQNSVDSAKSELDLKRAGYTSDQIKTQESKVSQANANLASQKAMVSQAYASIQQYQAQLAKAVLKAPFDGMITSMEAKVGEIVYPSSSASEGTKKFISIMSEGNFEIEADVPEVDIAKIKIGDEAKVTLDAYGEDVYFNAKVLMIDPAETIIEGVPTYKVTLQFIEQDERIKSGMTANVDIMTDKRDGVITIPQRAVVAKNGDKIVRLLKTAPDPKDNSETIETVEEVNVELGLRGSDGKVEILKGLNEGDKIVVFVKNQK
jgi:HlyD family secretion protein